MNDKVVKLDVPIVWACSCGCPHMRIYRNGLVKCCECEKHQPWIARNHKYDVIEDLVTKLDRIEASWRPPIEPSERVLSRYNGALLDIIHIAKYQPELKWAATIAKRAIIAAEKEAQ